MASDAAVAEIIIIIITTTTTITIPITITTTIIIITTTSITTTIISIIVAIIITTTIIYLLSNTEHQHILRACERGVNGVRFEKGHLKLLHLCIPLRNVVSFMTLHMATKSPVCFLQKQSCPCVRHEAADLDAAMERHRQGKRDRHLWRTVPELMHLFGLPNLLKKARSPC